MRLNIKARLQRCVFCHPMVHCCLMTHAEPAVNRGQDDHFLTPFALGARKVNWDFNGGKLDDVTAVVAYVVPSAKL